MKSHGNKDNVVTIQTKKKRVSIKMEKVEELDENNSKNNFNGSRRNSSLRFKTINPNTNLGNDVKKQIEEDKKKKRKGKRKRKSNL